MVALETKCSSTLVCIAANRKLDWVIPPANAESTCNYGLFQCFEMTNVKEKNLGYGPSNWQTIDTGLFHFDEDLFNNCPDNVNLNSYFQTEKYFKGRRADQTRLYL